MRIRVGMALAIGLVLAAAAVANAASGGVVPQAGDWEGAAQHGVPLSFGLVRQGGHLVASGLAVGYPASCPAVPRDAEATPVVGPAYAGPGGRTSPAAAEPVALSGRVPHSRQTIVVHGAFSSPEAGTLSIQIQKATGCGWPDKTLTWKVHRAARRHVADGTWTGPLTATGLINGNVRFVVAAEGRAIASLTGFFTCITDTQQGNETFIANPAFEFIRPDGSFFSPLGTTLLNGHPTTWSAGFSRAGRLAGTVTIFDNCTGRMIKARFAARRRR